MKSQSLEVLSEIRKTLSVLSIQIEKLSAALEEVEDDVVSEVKEADFSFEHEAVPGDEPRREDLETADEEGAVAVVEVEESPEVAVAEDLVTSSETEESIEDLHESEIDSAFDFDEELQRSGNGYERVTSENDSAFDFDEEAIDESGSASSANLVFEAGPVQIDELPPEDLSAADLPSDEVASELEAVDLSQDIEVGSDEMRLPDVSGFQWMIDIPGSKVSNVISAISLNDRVLLINTLFKENPELFQQTISKFNNMGSLSEAISYVLVTFPEWNLNSDVVYRLMMAVRRKLG